jgi:hypothetical protein
MSSKADLFNVPENTLRPSSQLVITKEPQGKVNASMMFTCRKNDAGRPVIQALLEKGTKIDVLYPMIGAEFAYLEVDSYKIRDVAGGTSEVDVEFIGYDDSEGEEDEKSIVYTRNDTLADESIFNHPKFLLLADDIKEGIRAGANGTARIVLSESNKYVRYWIGDTYICYLEDDDFKWWDYIVIRGNLTYQLPQSEWNKSATKAGKISSAQMEKFGLIDTPPGSPSKRAGQEWLFTGATESTTLIGDAPNSYTLTWTSGVWEDFIYSDDE